MNLRIKSDFTWAHRGVELKAYKAGDTVETDDADLVEVSVREGWAEHADETEGKARAGAPENKAKGGK